ncbi:MAG: hypothetical protein JWR52_3039 [Marmoricola sp.]|nr:hypothetical protein [Marmoricola sp.]
MRSHRRGGSAALIAALLVVTGLVTGCSDSTGPGVPGPSTATGAVSATEAQQLLNRRARAIRTDRLRLFLSTLDPTDPTLLTRQRRYFENMEQLPIQTLSYTVLKSDWPGELAAAAWGSGVSVPQVQVATQLRGFDTVPVTRITGFAFARKEGKPVILSELTGSGKQFPDSYPAPWDLVAIHVTASHGTLQVYDDGTWSESSEVSAVLRRGIADVRSGLPFAWNGRVVVYIVSSQAVLDSFQGVPGGDIEHLGAMTFPMYAVLGQPTVASSRFVLLPSSVQAGQPFLDRITRHELTHVAVGQRDDGVPTWLVEGIAEYMGARDLPRGQRRIATSAVARARAGVVDLPSSQSFNGPDQAWNYALSWMACDYIVATQGAAKMWELMTALHANGAGTPDVGEDAVLERILGYDGPTLASYAARRILNIYG